MQGKKGKKYYKLLAKIEKYEQITDNLEMEIAEYLTKVSEAEISHDSSKKIRAMLKNIDDMESVGDVIYQLSKFIDNYYQSKSRFTEHQTESINDMFILLQQAFIEMNHNLETGFKDVDISQAFRIEKEINETRDMLRQQHVEDLKEKKYKHKIGAFYSDMFYACERIGDYIVNVSEAMQEYQETK
jgi:phosphate:Na+ symporter